MYDQKVIFSHQIEMDSIIPLGQKTNTLAEYMILFSADNRPPMLDKDLYDSWKSRMELYMQNREHKNTLAEYMILSGADNCPPMLDKELVAKDLWEKVQLLMQDTSLTKHERECKLYDAFDKFTHIKRESLHTYYLRYTQLINDMNIYKMKMEQFQVNTKFLNSLPPEWSKFVTDVKLVKDLRTSNFDQLHAYLEQHELHANEVRLLRERNQDPLQQHFSPSQAYPYGPIHQPQQYSSTYLSQPQLNHSFVPPSHTFQSQMNHQTLFVLQTAYHSPQVPTQPMTELPLVDSGLAVLVFSLGDDPIACLNKAMAFLTSVASLRTAGSQRGDKGKVIMVLIIRVMLRVLGKTIQEDSSGNWKILDAEQLAFLAVPGIPDGQAIQTIIPNNVAFQTEDLDTYDSDCHDISNAKAVLMANISNYDSDVISEVPYSDTYLNDDIENQSVHAMQDIEQTPVVDFTDNEIHSDRNTIPYSQYLQETQQVAVQETNLQVQQDSMILSVIEQMSEQMINHVNN
ncbi:hypothetical protein Tco_0489362 [Tanacetum coccineum]